MAKPVGGAGWVGRGTRRQRMMMVGLLLALVMGSGLACISVEMGLQVKQGAEGEEEITIGIAQHLTDAYVAAAKAANVERAADYAAAGLPAPEPFPESLEGLGQLAQVPAGLSIVEQSDRGYTAIGTYSSVDQIDPGLGEGVSLSVDRSDPTQIRYAVQLQLTEIDPDLDLSGLDDLQSNGPGPKPPVQAESGGSGGGGGFLGAMGQMAEILSAITTDDIDIWYMRRILFEAGVPELQYVVELPGEIVVHEVDGVTAGHFYGAQNRLQLLIDVDFVNRFGPGTHFLRVESVINACADICGAMPHMVWDGQGDGTSCTCICEEGWQANDSGDCVTCDQVCAGQDPRATYNPADSLPNSCACQCSGRLLEFNEDEGCRCVTGAEPAGDECQCKPGWDVDSWGTGCVETGETDSAGVGAPVVGGADTTDGDTSSGETTGGDAAGGGGSGGDTAGGDGTSSPTASQSGPTAGQAAAGAVAVSVLMAGWAATQVLTDIGKGTEAVPAETPDLPNADPQKLEQLQTKFQDMVDQKIQEGFFVMNPHLNTKIWNWAVWLATSWWQKYQGGQCGEFATWGVEWSGTKKKPGFVQEIFGDQAVVDEIYVGEKTTREAITAWDWADWLVYRANHAATRVILPTGEAYVLDYWDSVVGRQDDLVADLAHGMAFGGPRPKGDVKLIPEHEWVKKWTQAIGQDDSELFNLHPAQKSLQECIAQSKGDLEKAFERFRNSRAMTRGCSDEECDMFINNWRRTPWTQYPVAPNQ